MHSSAHRSPIEPPGEGAVSLSLPGRPSQRKSALDWWYRVASPPELPRPTTFQGVERFRRGRAGSLLLLALLLLFVMALPTGILGTNPFLLPSVGGSIGALIAGVVLNRLGAVTLAGMLVVLTTLAFPLVTLLTTPGGISLVHLPLFGLLVLPLISTVSFLPPLWVFGVALVDLLAACCTLLLGKHTAELTTLLAQSFVGLMTPILLMQLLVSIVAFAWVQGMRHARLRADQAEEVARLEQDLALQAEQVARQKHQLEISIERIVQTHTRVANGDVHARVPQTPDRSLWPISSSLNTLLASLHRLRQEVAEGEREKQLLQQVREENSQLVRRLRKSTPS